ncbi:MAG: IPT/TIG domain-containing protein, partial [Planctomycetes bacterium]|nr:IPT/TIG domain-containing protein [Planctomycetota bacterium]
MRVFVVLFMVIAVLGSRAVGQPQIDTVSPGTVSYLGGPFTITGSGFTPGCSVSVDGIEADSVFVDSTTLTATAPVRTDVVSGQEVIVIVSDPVLGKDQTTILYWAEFSVTDLDPALVPADVPSTVVLRGTGFTAHTRVRVDEIPCPFTFIDHTRLDATVPALPNGLYPLRVFDAVLGVTFVEESFSGGIQYFGAALPTIDRVEPASVCATKLTEVTLYGEGFVPDSTVYLDTI